MFLQILRSNMEERTNIRINLPVHLTPCAAISKEKTSEINWFQRFLVRVERFERSAPWTQSRRATNCATPGYWVVLSGWAYSPKCRVLPTALHPVIQFVYPAGRILPNHPLCQSRWFQIFVLVHYSTVFWRFKVFSVCNFIVVIQKNFQRLIVKSSWTLE